MINKELKQYLNEFILPLYEKNDWAHQAWHIYEVIERSLKLAKNLNVDFDMVYTIAVFHDIPHFQEAKSSKSLLKNDKKLTEFFSKEQIDLMEEAIIDYHSTLEQEPRNIYGKIIATANQFTNIKEILRSIHSDTLQFFPNLTFSKMFERTYSYIKMKYEKDKNIKTYLPNADYELFRKEMKYYLNNPLELKKLFQKTDAFLRKIYHLPKITYPTIKRYHTIDEELKEKFGGKVFKISLNAGFDCPNKKNGHGCIFCSNQSGDFAGNKEDAIEMQFQKIKKLMNQKWESEKYIAYFQAGTNTYAPLNILKEKFETALKIPNVVGLSIATRSDAIEKEALDYLEELNTRTYLTIELGLQSIHDKTLKWINRGHTLENFEQMVRELHKRHINVVVHIINGFPNETKEDMLKTVRYLNQLPISGIKIHMLHILKDTPLGDLYQKKPFPLLTKEEYIDIVCNQLELLNSNIIIHRITGDPKKEDLIAPSWLLKKFVILNDIDKELEKRNTYQGKLTS